MPCWRQSEALDRSVKRTAKVFPLSRSLFHSLITYIRQYYALRHCLKPNGILKKKKKIQSKLPFIYIDTFGKLSMYLTRCWQFSYFSLNILVFFKDRSDAWKMETSTMLLKLCFLKLEKNISVFCNYFWHLNLLSFMTSSFVIWLKAKTEPLLVFWYIAKILWWFRDFSVTFKVRPWKRCALFEGYLKF